MPTSSQGAPVYVNIAYYKFVTIDDPVSLRKVFLDLCNTLSLKGTILLAHEGINSCLVGRSEAIDRFIDFMRADVRFADIEFKKSYSLDIPFRRMLVKIKREIIPIGDETIKPEAFTGKYVSALELKKWLDEGEDLVILDTRNDYEVDVGTFRGAIDPRLRQFRDFPEWIRNNFSSMKKKKIVTFCTGGIRCEKATAFMLREGFEDVYQLQGGILKYFEETAKHAPEQDNYYDGDCFVFDYRVAVDKRLKQASYEICFNCWSTLSAEDLQHSHYIKDKHCPHCYERYLCEEMGRQVLMQENNRKALQQRKVRSALMREKVRQEIATQENCAEK